MLSVNEPVHNDEKESGVLITRCVTTCLTLLVAVGGIVYIELEALRAGIDGKVLTICVGAICLIVGVGAKDVINLIRGRVYTRKK